MLVVSAATQTAPPRATPKPATAPTPAPAINTRLVQAVPPPPPPPALRTAPPHPNKRIAAGRIVCWQVSAVLVLASLQQPWPILTAALITAGLLTAVTTIRIGGRLVPEVAVLGLRFLARQRKRDLPEHEKALALLDLLLPETTLTAVHTGHKATAAVSHEYGVTAIIRANASAGPTALLEAAGTRQGAVQAVFHAGADRTPRQWLAVHIPRTPTTTDDELVGLLGNALRRVLRAVKKAEPLDEQAALAAVAALGHITGGRTEVREEWSFWRTGPVVQACFLLPGWDGLSDHGVGHLLTRLLHDSRPAAATVAVTARTGVPVEAVLRLAATTEAAISAAAATAARHAAAAGVRLDRLDGAHHWGVTASLPIGGPPR